MMPTALTPLWLAGLTLGALVSSCASAPPSHATLGPPVTGKPVVVAEGRGYLTLEDGNVHFDQDGTPRGFYVAGVIEGGRFIPEGDVLGDSPAVEELGTAGWLELLDASFYGAASGREPVRPYVRGTLSADGLFRPSERKVIY
jgi:hypothetical protein